MKHFIFILLLALPLVALGQYNNNPNKIRLGHQTTGTGLIAYGSGAPLYTPINVNNANHYQDTTNNVLYFYDFQGSTWVVFSAADGNGLISGLPIGTVAINADSNTLSITNMNNLILTGSGTFTIQKNGAGNFNVKAPEGSILQAADIIDLNADTSVVLRVEGQPFFSVGHDGIGIENPVLDSITETTHLIGLPGTSGIATILPLSELATQSALQDTAAAIRADIPGDPDYGAILYVATTGNNSTAEVGNPHKPYLTIDGAFAAATDGDMIHFLPGSFTSTANLGTKSLYWYLSRGTVLSGSGIRWDLSAGKKVYISGNGVISFNSGTSALKADGAGEYISVRADSIYIATSYAAQMSSGGAVDIECRAMAAGTIISVARVESGASKSRMRIGNFTTIGTNPILMQNGATGTGKFHTMEIDRLTWTSTNELISIPSDMTGSSFSLRVNNLFDDVDDSRGMVHFSNSGAAGTAESTVSLYLGNYNGAQSVVRASTGSIAIDTTSAINISCRNCRYTGSNAAVWYNAGTITSSYMPYNISGNWTAENSPLLKDSTTTANTSARIRISDAVLKVENGAWYAIHVYGFAATGSVTLNNVTFQGQDAGVAAVSCATASTFYVSGAFQGNTTEDADATFTRLYELGVVASAGTTDLTLTGASTPFTLNSSTGTDVTFSEGYGINQARTSNDLQTAVDTAQIATAFALQDTAASIRADFPRSIYTGAGLLPDSANVTNDGFKPLKITHTGFFGGTPTLILEDSTLGGAPLLGIELRRLGATIFRQTFDGVDLAFNAFGSADFSLLTSGGDINLGPGSGQIRLGTGVTNTILPKVRPGSNSFWRFNSDGSGEYIDATTLTSDISIYNTSSSLTAPRKISSAGNVLEFAATGVAQTDNTLAVFDDETIVGNGSSVAFQRSGTLVGSFNWASNRFTIVGQKGTLGDFSTGFGITNTVGTESIRLTAGTGGIYLDSDTAKVVLTNGTSTTILPNAAPGVNSFWLHRSDGWSEYISAATLATQSALDDTAEVIRLYVDSLRVIPPGVENIENSTFTALLWIINQVDVSGGAVTVDPPASPAIGHRFAVVDATADADTNNITVDFTGAGQDLYGSSQDYIINVAGGYVEFIYMGSTTGWIATKG